MENINSQNLEELGGFHSFEIIPITDILTSPTVLTNSNVSKFTYTKNKSNNTIIQPVGETLIVSCKPRKTAQGLLYRISSSLEIKSPSSEIDTLLNKIINQGFVLKVNTYADSSILYGSKIFPLELSYQHVYSKKQETPAKTVVSIKGKIPQKPVYTTNK
ncbi:hypothetical protein [Tenacibaculum halocynthiae]|uniref:hypothetical protein n=1 Tax=Tenacibaculum halocynthiae TaxID=1254437 RepID=UPI003D64EEE0